MNNQEIITQSKEWSLTAYESNGNLWLRWDTEMSVRPQEGQVVVYNNDVTGFPEKANHHVRAWQWDDANGNWDTGLPYGSNWHCARIGIRGSKDQHNRSYYSFIKLITE